MALTNPRSAEHIAQGDGSFEPQRQNNFSIEIPLSGADRDLIVMGAHGFTLPQQTNAPVIIEFQNQKRKVAGAAEVEEANLMLKDFIDQDVRGAILRWRKEVYNPLTGDIGLAANYKRTGSLVLHGPDGSNERVAKIIGIWPSADPTVEVTHEGGQEKLLMEVPIQIDLIDWSETILGA